MSWVLRDSDNEPRDTSEATVQWSAPDCWAGRCGVPRPGAGSSLAAAATLLPTLLWTPWTVDMRNHATMPSSQLQTLWPPFCLIRLMLFVCLLDAFLGRLAFCMKIILHSLSGWLQIIARGPPCATIYAAESPVRAIVTQQRCHTTQPHIPGSKPGHWTRPGSSAVVCFIHNISVRL